MPRQRLITRGAVKRGRLQRVYAANKVYILEKKNERGEGREVGGQWVVTTYSLSVTYAPISAMDRTFTITTSSTSGNLFV